MRSTVLASSNAAVYLEYNCTIYSFICIVYIYNILLYFQISYYDIPEILYIPFVNNCVQNGVYLSNPINAGADNFFGFQL